MEKVVLLVIGGANTDDIKSQNDLRQMSAWLNSFHMMKWCKLLD